MDVGKVGADATFDLDIVDEGKSPTSAEHFDPTPNNGRAISHVKTTEPQFLTSATFLLQRLG